MLQINCQAISSIDTTLAVIVALFLPFWHRRYVIHINLINKGRFSEIKKAIIETPIIAPIINT